MEKPLKRERDIPKEIRLQGTRATWNTQKTSIWTEEDPLSPHFDILNVGKGQKEKSQNCYLSFNKSNLIPAQT